MLLATLPIALAIAALVLAVRTVLWVVGVNSRSRYGRSLFDELLLHRLLEILSRRPDPANVYDHIVETSTGQVLARQLGEFRDGRILVGHRVRLFCERWRGARVIREGFNETLGDRLTPEGGGARAVFFGLLFMVVLEYGFLAMAGLGLNGR